VSSKKRRKSTNTSKIAGARSVRKIQERTLVCAGSDGHLSGDELDTRVTLKNGKRLDVRRADLLFDILQSIFVNDPEHFTVIRRVVSGKDAGASADITNELCESGILDELGRLRPDVFDVFVSAYRMTKEGDVFANPFAPSSEREASLIKSLELRVQSRARKFMRQLREKPDDEHRR